MTDFDHRVGVQEANLVVRHLKLENVNAENKLAMIAEIDQIFGLDNVSFDEKTQSINLAYDASRCNIESLEEIIKKHGADIAHDIWTHFKESYYQYVDQNVKDNAEHEPWRCHKTPPGSKK